MFWRTSFLFVSFFNDFSEENFVPFLRQIIVSRNDDAGYTGLNKSVFPEECKQNICLM